MFLKLFVFIYAIMSGPYDLEDYKPYLKIYNIQDLEVIIPNYTNVPNIDLNSVLSSNQGGSVFANTQNQNSPIGQKRSEEIMNLIQELIEPEAWGDVATMRYWNGNIIVKAPKRIHDQLD